MLPRHHMTVEDPDIPFTGRGDSLKKPRTQKLVSLFMVLGLALAAE